MKQNFRNYIDYWKIIDSRWNFQSYYDLHVDTKHYGFKSRLRVMEKGCISHKPANFLWLKL